MGIEIHRFTTLVNCDVQGKTERLCEDNGFIMLPDGYSNDGVATRLVISCHGAGGTVTTDDSQIEKQAFTQYLVANGYAVMDVNGLPQEYADAEGIDLRNNIGSPIATQSYVKAYYYCMEKFNLKPEVFVHGGSMGGISSTNLVLSGLIPVIAHSAFCPVLDTYNQIFLHPWSGGLPKTALGKIYGLDTDQSGEYIYDEQKILGANPVNNKRAEKYPVPVKFWHCLNDEIVSCEVTKSFVEMINKNGGNAQLRTFPEGGHEPQLYGELVKTGGINVYKGEILPIKAAAEEAYQWIKSND